MEPKRKFQVYMGMIGGVITLGVVGVLLHPSEWLASAMSVSTCMASAAYGFSASEAKHMAENKPQSPPTP